VVFNVVHDLVGIDAVVLITCRLFSLSRFTPTKWGPGGFDPLNGENQQRDSKRHILARKHVR